MNDLALLNTIENEEYVMRIAQGFFDQSSPSEPISLGREMDGCVCLERDSVLIAIYFSERDGKNLIALFKSIYHALDFLAARYLGMPKMPLDWVSLNQEFDRQHDIL
jgi:hypothetical protein